MVMRDNKTSQPSSEYDANVSKTIPYYMLFHEETIKLVKACGAVNGSWLDTGCGTGNFILKAKEHFPGIQFIAADPAKNMLEIAQEKCSEMNIPCILAGTEELNQEGPFSVITAILAHHYLDEMMRRKATKNCYAMLKPGGVYVTFETIRPATEAGTKIGLKRWRDAQVANGKSAESADKHVSRYGTELLPITIDAHLALLKETGFSTVEILWVSGMQAGFYAIK
ncbi:MAG: cmoA [Firmicutes bacterium]|nr:cmoA [Bacillota bacterium]